METNRDRFLESLINREHTVLGRALKPFCLWHMIHFGRVRSPFLRAKAVMTPTLLDLAIAVAICTTGPEDPLSAMKPQLQIWRERPVTDVDAWSVRHGKPALELVDTDFTVELAKFRTYQRDFAARFRCKDAKGEPLKCPWEIAVIARLMRYGKYTEYEALTKPFGWVMNMSLALGEANGGTPPLMSAELERTMIEAGWTLEDD